MRGRQVDAVLLIDLLIKAVEELGIGQAPHTVQALLICSNRWCCYMYGGNICAVILIDLLINAADEFAIDDRAGPSHRSSSARV
jgi:hypothetical protein